MRIMLSAVVVCSLVGCGKKKEAPPPAEQKSKVIELDTSKPGVPPGAPPLNGEAVNTCAFLTKDQIKTVIGEDPKDPKVDIEPAGSELGQCSWTSSSFMVQVHARPASEFDGTVRDIKDGKEIPGVGEKAVMTGAQILVKVPSKPYFLQVMVAGPSSATAEQKEQRVTEMAKAVVAGAK